MKGDGTGAFERAAKRWIEPLRKLAPVSIRVIPVGPPNQLPTPDASSVCMALGRRELTWSLCRLVHHQLRSRSVLSKSPEQTVCPCGLALFAVPVMEGSKALGWIEGGCVFTEAPSERMFLKIQESIAEADGPCDLKALRIDYFGTPVVSTESIASIVDLVRVVSAGIAREAQEQALGGDKLDPPAIARAKELVEQGYATKLKVATVARGVCLSEDHFSRLFKRVAGITFTEYVGRVRVTHAQHILVTSQKQIAEVAFECGFESIPHFNRMFKRFAGMAPKLYRASQQGELHRDLPEVHRSRR